MAGQAGVLAGAASALVMLQASLDACLPHKRTNWSSFGERPVPGMVLSFLIDT